MTAIRTLREQHGISLRWLASQLGVSRTTLWRYERGEVQPPKSVVFHAAHLLHTTPDTLEPR